MVYLPLVSWKGLSVPAGQECSLVASVHIFMYRILIFFNFMLTCDKQTLFLKYVITPICLFVNLMTLSVLCYFQSLIHFI